MSKLNNLFAEYCGDETYRKFLRQTPSRGVAKPRLRWWQEKLWSRFVLEYPEFSSFDVNQIIQEFSICHVHLLPLVAVEVPVQNGVIDVYWDREFEKLWADQFPNAIEFLVDSPHLADGSKVVTQQCPEFRRLFQTYQTT